jgi:hypothetical protein
MTTWLKRIGMGVVAVATIAGGALVATCQGDADCYQRAWPGAVLQGVVGAFTQGGTTNAGTR